VLLWGGGILAFIVLHILQARTSQHFTIPDFLDILLIPPLIGILFFLGLWWTTSVGRATRLKVFGRTARGVPVPGTAKVIYQGNGAFEDFTDVEFQTPNGVRHQIEAKGWWTEQSVHLRYDPFDLSNAVVSPPSQLRQSLVQTFWEGVVYCGCLLFCIAVLGVSFIFFGVLLLSFFVSTTPSHP
jgi:hypothetical protein